MNRSTGSTRKRILPKNLPIKPKKLLPMIPTLVIGIAVITLTVIPKSQIIKLTLQNDQFVFITNIKPDFKISPIKDIPVNNISISNFDSVKIGYKKLSALKTEGTDEMLDDNGTVHFFPQLTNNELKFSGKNEKEDIIIRSLEIGGESLIKIAIRKSDGYNKLCLQIQQFPAILRLQFTGNDVIATAKGCVIDYKTDGKIKQVPPSYQQHLEIFPSEASAIYPISSTDNLLKFEILMSKDESKPVFESEIPLKMIGFEDSDISLDPERILKAKCKLLQIDDSPKGAYIDQNVFFKQQDLNQLKLEGIEFFLDREKGKNINLNFSGYKNNFKVGLHEERIRNIMPSFLVWLSKSPWAITAGILAWLITSSLLAFDILYRRRVKEEK